MRYKNQYSENQYLESINDRLLHFAEMVKIAEDVGTKAINDSYRNKIGFDVLQTVYINDEANNILRDVEDYVSFGYVAKAPDTNDYVIAIRGTGTLLEWVQDARFGRIANPNGGRTEKGFTELYSTLRVGPADSYVAVVDFLADLLKDKSGVTLTICGHSLGGALSTLLAVDMVKKGFIQKDRLSVYTYASPCVGDRNFAVLHDSLGFGSYRVVNRGDIVPSVPPTELGYEHVGKMLVLEPGKEVKNSIPCQHYLTTYLYLLGKRNNLEEKDYSLDIRCKLKKQNFILSFITDFLRWALRK